MGLDKIVNSMSDHYYETDKLYDDLCNYYYSMCNIIYNKMKELEPDLPNVEFLLETKADRAFNARVEFIDKSETKLNYIIKTFNITKINVVNEDSIFDKTNIQLMQDFDISFKDYYCDVNLIITILHELGHVYFAKTYIEKNRLLDKYRFYKNINDNQIRLLFHKKDMSSCENHILYRLRQTELFADNFAYRYFYIIWKYLNEVYIK